MMQLEDFRPTGQERAAVEGMPEQVAIGYLRAARRANGGKSSGQPDSGLGDLFGGLFGNMGGA